MRFVLQHLNIPGESCKYTFNHNTGNLVTNVLIQAIKEDNLYKVENDFISISNLWAGAENQMSYYNAVEINIKSFSDKEEWYTLNIDLEF
jgi:hypothetical protein